MTTITAANASPVVQYFLALKLKDQREYLGNLRGSDPASARRLVESIWSQSDAVSRCAYIDTFVTGLSLADEAFLESALDDRSKRIRSRAAYSLSILPSSRLLQRFTEQAVNHLDYMIHMRPNTPDKIHVTLPTAYTATMKRDGIQENPFTPGSSAPAFWLFQMVNRVPPETWARRWNKTPEQLIDAAFNTQNYGKDIVTAWINATFAYKDPDWAEALLSYDLSELSPISPSYYLLQLVRPDHREQIIETNLRNHPNVLYTTANPIYTLWHLEQPWSPHFSQFILERLTHYANPSTPTDLQVILAIQRIGNSLAPAVYPEAQQLLGPPNRINPSLAAQVATILITLESKHSSQ